MLPVRKLLRGKMTTTPKADPKLAKVLRVSAKSRGRRSPLYLWMKQNFAELAAEFQENGPRWQARVKAMKAAGLVDWNRNAPTVRGAQQTWYRLCRDMEKAPATSVARPETSQPPPPNPARTVTATPAPPTPAPTAASLSNPWAELDRQTAETKRRRDEIAAAKEWNPYATPKEKPE